MHSFDSLQLMLVSGKGGVGKTTLACGLARRWAQHLPHNQILLLSTDPAHSLGDVLQLTVTDTAQTTPDLPNLHVRALDAQALLQAFKARYGAVLELLVERGSFVQGEDLSPVWDLGWPGLDELMGILEIQRVLREGEADRVVVDMAPSGHTLNLLGLMDFLEAFLNALDLFQEKHRVIRQTFSGRDEADEADAFLAEMHADLMAGRSLLHDAQRTACLLVAIAEPMSWFETQRFLQALTTLNIPCGGLIVNRLAEKSTGSDRLHEQTELLPKFWAIASPHPLWVVPEHPTEPVGTHHLDHLITQLRPITDDTLREWERSPLAPLALTMPEPIPPGFHDFMAEGQRLIIVGGKGGVGKTTIAAAIAWGMATTHPDRVVRVISIDPAHSLGDALGQPLGHIPQAIATNLSGQEVDADQVLQQFRDDYLWELAEMMSGDVNDAALKIAYGPEAWRQIVSQALPGIDEMLSLITVMELLERGEQDLIVLDTAPTGHLLRFLEMPTALGNWLAWIFKLWLKYQDVVGRVELMGRLRTLRQRVMQAQKKLKDATHTEFVGVVQAQSAILAEAERLIASLDEMGIAQRYLVHNRYCAGQSLTGDRIEHQTIVRLPELPRAIAPAQQIQIAAGLLFATAPLSGDRG